MSHRVPDSKPAITPTVAVASKPVISQDCPPPALYKDPPTPACVAFLTLARAMPSESQENTPRRLCLAQYTDRPEVFFAIRAPRCDPLRSSTDSLQGIPSPEKVTVTIIRGGIARTKHRIKGSEIGRFASGAHGHQLHACLSQVLRRVYLRPVQEVNSQDHRGKD